MEGIILKLPFIPFRWKNTLCNKWYKKTAKCDLCGNSLFSFGSCHGAIDVYEGTNKNGKKHTAYLCNLCYKLSTD